MVAAATRSVGRGARRVRLHLPGLLETGAQPARNLRAAADRNYWRGFPHAAERTTGLLLGDAVLLALGWVLHPVLFASMAAALGATAVRLAWRARPGWGRERGWPAGSVGLGPEPLVRHDAFARAWARHGPVFKSNQLRMPMVCIADLELGTALLREHALDLGPAAMSYNRFVPGGMVRWAPEPRHTELRRLLLRGVTPRFVQSWEPRMAELFAAGLARMEADSRHTPGGIHPSAEARESMLAAWSEVILGILSDGPAYPEVRTLIDELAVYRRRMPSDADSARWLERLTALVREANRRPADAGRPASLAASLARLQPESLDDEGVVRNLVYLVITTREDLASLMVWLLAQLTTEPRWIDRVRSDMAEGGDLVDRAVSETLRLEQSEFLLRRATREIRFRGVVVPEGWIVRVCIHEIHRDPAVFVDPERFDPDRFLRAELGRDVVASFGVDHHSCVAEGLSRAVGRVFVTEAVQGYDWTTMADGPREYTRLRHWAPSSRLRLGIRARGRPATEESLRRHS